MSNTATVTETTTPKGAPRLGRPPASDSARNIRWQISLSQPEAESIEAAAGAAVVSRSEWIRRAIAKAL